MIDFEKTSARISSDKCNIRSASTATVVEQVSKLVWENSRPHRSNITLGVGARNCSRILPNYEKTLNVSANCILFYKTIILIVKESTVIVRTVKATHSVLTSRYIFSYQKKANQIATYECFLFVQVNERNELVSYFFD